LDLGFATAGRPSCTGGTTQLVELVRSWNVRSVAVFADNDEPGMRGAEALAATLLAYARDVRVVRSPAGIKDVREWVRSGARHEQIEAAIHAARARSLTIRLMVGRSAKGGKEGRRGR
jgi:DNA primase